MSVRALILAGGKGTRMGAPVPKALVEICGTPIIDHLLNAVEQSGIDAHPAVVIGHDLEKLRDHMGDRVETVIQNEQRGTGHAVMVARDQLKDVGTIVVMYGDHPLYRPDTFQQIVERHESSGAAVTLLTTILPDYDDWRGVFTHFGRIIRNENGGFRAITEYKLCSEEEKRIKEVNNGLYCFDGHWLWENIDQLSDDNAKEEFLLTDMLAIAVEQGKIIETVSCLPEEGIGTNTSEEVKIAEKVLCGNAE